MELTDHDVHCLYLHHPDQLVWCKMIVVKSLTTGELMSLLHTV